MQLKKGFLLKTECGLLEGALTTFSGFSVGFLKEILATALPGHIPWSTFCLRSNWKMFINSKYHKHQKRRDV